MPVWAWILIAAVAVVVVVAIAAKIAMRGKRTGRLQEQFGPEYDHALESSDSRRAAEAELAEREQRRQELDIVPLSREARATYIERWQGVQAEFVDNPRFAVTSADTLIQSAMADRGCPVDVFDQRAADLSVDHAEVVETYREGHRLATSDDGSTEDLRQAMRHYRALFAAIVEPD